MANIRKMITLSEQNVEDFNARFPGDSLSWALDMLLEKFNAQFNHTASEYAAIAAEQLHEELGNGNSSTS